MLNASLPIPPKGSFPTAIEVVVLNDISEQGHLMNNWDSV
jgi:hypothetical protein